MFDQHKAKKHQAKPQSLSAIQRQEEDYNGYSSPGEAYANRPIPNTGFDYMQLLRVPKADEPIQEKADESAGEIVSPEAEVMGTENEEVIQEKSEDTPNWTGLPDDLKAGVENLSGYSLDDVRVHYNSPKPAQLQALAYTQGTEIHVASGQEEHLPHEAWHVVQQMQGRVKPTMQMKGVHMNDDQGLEREANVMGSKANSSASQERFVKSCTSFIPISTTKKLSPKLPIQCVLLYRGMRAALEDADKPIIKNLSWGLGVRDNDVTLDDNNYVIQGGMSTSNVENSVPNFTISKSYQGGSHNTTDQGNENFRWKWSIDDQNLPEDLMTLNDHGDHVLIKPSNDTITLDYFRTLITDTQDNWDRINP
ncbi:MAG: DUF4157 domain-containing protein [Microcystaceae cyanobacterium]